MGDLLERERELAALATALAAAQRGTGAVVMLEGPAGIGKSRLLAAARAAARDQDIPMLEARGRELEQDIPFGAALELFTDRLAAASTAERERLFAGQADLARVVFDGVPVAGDPQAVVRGLYWLTSGLTGPPRRRRPLVLALDDAQWSDRPSLAFLAHLAGRLDGLPVALLLAVRRGEPAGDDELLGVLRAASGGALLAPAPLSEAGVGRLVAEDLPDPEPSFVAACARVSGGNPFLTRELARALRDDAVRPTAGSVAQVEQLVPASVLRSLLTRLGRLGDAPRRVATAAAVLGDGASLRHAAQLAGLAGREAEAAADGLAEAGILLAGEPLRFVHPLIATAVHSDLPAFGRARAHREAATQLAGDGVALQEVAAHLLLSRPEDDPWVVTTLREAARRAVGQGDSRAAARLLARALAEPPGPADRAGVLLELAGAEALHGDVTAEVHASEALALVDGSPERGAALRVLSRVWLGLRKHDAAAAALGELLGELDPQAPERERVLAEYLTVNRFAAPLHAETVRHLAPTVEAARRGAPPRDPVLLSHVALELALGGERPEAIRDLAERAVADDPLGDAETHGMAMGMVVQALCVVDEVAAAERIADAALVAARRQGAFLAAATASYHRAIPRYHRGALADALADLDLAQAPMREGWPAGGAWAFALEAHVHAERGDVPAARAALERAPEVPGSMDLAILWFARARVALTERDPAALAAAETAGHLLADGFGIDHPGLVPWRRTAALAALRTGDRVRASELARAELQRARAVGVPRAIGVALRTEAALAGREERVALLTEATTVLAAGPARLERAHALADLGAALRRAGRRAAALGPLREALQLADSMGAGPLAEVAREELHACGARPRRAAYTGVDALTPAERRVAQLAARGLTNRQVAEELFVTQKTVQTHLAHAYRKLGITSRRQIAAVLR